MRNYLKFMVLGVVLSGITGLLTVGTVQAQDSDVFCAAVLPCDSEGNVLPAFNQGPCAELYSTQCANMATAQLGQQLQTCQDKGSDLQKEINKLRKKVRRAKQNKRSS